MVTVTIFLAIAHHASGPDDVLVRAAAAQVAGEGALDFLVGGVRRAVEKRLQTHDLARRAVAALEGVGLDERALQRVQHSAG